MFHSELSAIYMLYIQSESMRIFYISSICCSVWQQGNPVNPMSHRDEAIGRYGRWTQIHAHSHAYAPYEHVAVSISIQLYYLTLSHSPSLSKLRVRLSFKPSTTRNWIPSHWYVCLCVHRNEIVLFCRLKLLSFTYTIVSYRRLFVWVPSLRTQHGDIWTQTAL